MRAFMGAKEFEVSRCFYRDLGFEEIPTAYNMSYFKMGNFGFYLQDAYVKDWVDNTMIFMEVENVESHLEAIKKLELTAKYKNVRVSEISYNDRGNEFFMHDPSGILWHIGEFVK